MMQKMRDFVQKSKNDRQIQAGRDLKVDLMAFLAMSKSLTVETLLWDFSTAPEALPLSCFAPFAPFWLKTETVFYMSLTDLKRRSMSFLYLVISLFSMERKLK